MNKKNSKHKVDHASESRQSITLPNYCTHAAQYFLEVAKSLDSFGIKNDFEHFLSDYLCESIKFMLPDNGHLFEDHDFKPSMFELQKLPYPSCSLEFAANDELYKDLPDNWKSTKRIALCFDPYQLSEIQKSRLTRMLGGSMVEVPQHSICVIAVYESGVFS